jgi:hypothetical protein
MGISSLRRAGGRKMLGRKKSAGCEGYSVLESRDKSMNGKTRSQGVPFGIAPSGGSCRSNVCGFAVRAHLNHYGYLKSAERKHRSPTQRSTPTMRLTMSGTGGESENPRPRVVGKEKVCATEPMFYKGSRVKM